MSIISNVLHNSIDTIQLVTLDAYNTRNNTVVYSDVPCRWEKKTNIITNRDAIPQISTVEVWMLPDYDITYNHEFIVDDEVYKIVGIDTRRDLNGQIDHLKVFLA